MSICSSMTRTWWRFSMGKMWIGPATIVAGFLIIVALFLAGCAAGGSYRDNTTYTDGYLHAPIDNDIYN